MPPRIVHFLTVAQCMKLMKTTKKGKADYLADFEKKKKKKKKKKNIMRCYKFGDTCNRNYVAMFAT